MLLKQQMEEGWKQREEGKGEVRPEGDWKGILYLLRWIAKGAGGPRL